jgi:outer membrane protein assembly factor BamB
VALNKKTGDVLWKSADPGGDAAGYASVGPPAAAGKKQYVQFLATGRVGADADSGKFLWRFEETAKGSPANIPTPVYHNSMVYSAASMGTSGPVKLTAAGEGVKAERVYTGKKYPHAIGGSIVIGDHLYGTTNSALMCIEFATGKEKWSERGVGAGSLLLADGRLYVHGEKGEVALVEPSPEGYREKGRFSPPEAPNFGQTKAWAYPVVANGRLYIRDADVVWCYDVRDPNAVN